MSDFTFKVWPKEDVQESKVELIIAQLKKDKVISQESEYFGEPAYNPGEKLGELIGIKREEYINRLKVQVKENDYGVGYGKEDFEIFDRKNVVCVQNGDGEIENWKRFEEYLKNLTGWEYEGGIDIL